MKNDQVLQECIFKALKETFEEMAFLDVIMEPDSKQETGFENHLKIDILEPVKAKIIFSFSDSFKNIVAENIFGQEYSSLTENDLDDSLLELLNIFAGRFLSLYFGKETYHKVDFPELIVDLNAHVQEKESLVDLFFTTEDGAFEIKIIEGI